MHQFPQHIVLYPNTILRKKTATVAPDFISSGQASELAAHMFDLMYQAKGVGLAAPQIGLDLRMTVIDPQDGSHEPIVLINPEITKHSKLSQIGEEGCLSLPGVFGSVKRFRSVTISYTDSEGKTQTLKAPPFLSRIIQHELDHLDGVLFIDKLDGALQAGAEQLKKWDAGEKTPLPIPYPYTYGE